MAILHPWSPGSKSGRPSPSGRATFGKPVQSVEWPGLAGKLLMLVPVPAIQLEELIHELSSDNVGENPSSHLLEGVFRSEKWLTSEEVHIRGRPSDGLNEAPSL